MIATPTLAVPEPSPSDGAQSNPTAQIVFPRPSSPSTPAPSDRAASDRLRQLEQLREANLVTDAEYREKRQEILDRV